MIDSVKSGKFVGHVDVDITFGNDAGNVVGNIAVGLRREYGGEYRSGDKPEGGDGCNDGLTVGCGGFVATQSVDNVCGSEESDADEQDGKRNRGESCDADAVG